MGTLADLLIPLAGSISNERAIKMREACDALEAKIDIAQRGMNHAHDLISLLTDRVKELERDNLDRRLTSLERAVDVLDRQRVETLKLRVNGLERDYVRKGEVGSYIIALRREVLERVEKLESATKNTGEGAPARVATCAGSQTASGNASATHSRSETQAEPPSSASSVPAPVCEVCGDTDPMFRLGGVWRCSECHREHHDKMRAKAPNSITLPILDVKRLYGIDTDVPAPATGEVPKWVPSPRELVLAHYQGIKENLDAEHVWDHVRRLIAIRAPAAPVVDVNALLTRFYSELDVCDLESKAMTRALAAQGVKCKEVQT